MKPLAFDKLFLGTALVLLVWGFFIFLSVANTLLGDPLMFISTVAKQLVAIVIGLAVIWGVIFYKKFTYKYLHEHTPKIYIAVVLLTLLVFIPGIGVEVNGAQRWINLGFTNIQPSEFLKIGTIMFFASILAAYGSKIKNIIPLLTALAVSLLVPFAILFFANDFGTVLVLSTAVLVMLLVAPTNKLYLLLLAIVGGVLLFSGIYLFKPYAFERVSSFFDKNVDILDQGFHTNQSLIAIGSGEVFGRGYGQSLQKFSYLPEPMTDSIFAVMSEELGFFLTSVFLLIFLMFVIRGYHIGSAARDKFGHYLVHGLVTLLGAQSLLNIMTMVKLFPLSGEPLIFVSQGGSVMLGALICVALILSVSRFIRKKI